MHDTSTAVPRSLAGRREWIGLAVLGLPTLLLSLDTSVLNLALPELGRDLGASSTQQLWILDIYGFVLSGFLVTMGTLGDRIGRRKLLLLGSVGFGLASTLAALSTSAGMLIAGRALMGATGATLMPSALALITTMFADAKQRSVAISVWFSCLLGGLAIGPVAGGLLLHWFWWGSVFLLGAPVMLLLLVTGPRLLPEHRGGRERLDLTSVALSLAAILLVIHGLTDLARHGAGTVRIASLLVGLAVGAIFVLRQRRLADPLLDIRLFGNRSFSAALTVLLFGGVTQAGIYLLTSLYLQTVAGLSPLHAGLLLVPSAIAMISTITTSPVLAQRIRPGLVIAGGLVVATVGYILFTLAGPHSLPLVVVGIALVGFGSGPMVALTTNLVVGSAPPERAGSAAAIAETSGQFGIAFGVASIGSLATLAYGSQLAADLPAGLPAGVSGTARESVIGGIAAAQQVSGALGAQLLDVVRAAFSTGVNLGGGIGAIVTVGLIALAVVSFRHVRPLGQPAAGAAESAPDIEPDATLARAEPEAPAA